MHGGSDCSKKGRLVGGSLQPDSERSRAPRAGLSVQNFAVAKTRPERDLHIPTLDQTHGERERLRTLSARAPQRVAGGMSFLMGRIFWDGRQTELNPIRGGWRGRSRIHAGFLLGYQVVAAVLAPAG